MALRPVGARNRVIEFSTRSLIGTRARVRSIRSVSTRRGVKDRIRYYLDLAGTELSVFSQNLFARSILISRIKRPYLISPYLVFHSGTAAAIDSARYT